MNNKQVPFYFRIEPMLLKKVEEYSQNKELKKVFIYTIAIKNFMSNGKVTAEISQKERYGNQKDNVKRKIKIDDELAHKIEKFCFENCLRKEYLVEISLKNYFQIA